MQRLLLDTQMARDSGGVAQGALRARECGPGCRSLEKQPSSREPSSPPAWGVWRWVQPQTSPFLPVCSGFRQERPRRVCHRGRSVAGVGCAEVTWVEEPTTPPTGWRASGRGQEPREGQAIPTRSSQSSWPGVANPSCLCPVPDTSHGATPPKRYERWPWVSNNHTETLPAGPQQGCNRVAPRVARDRPVLGLCPGD